MIGIYKITSPSGKVYIGQSVDIYKRWYIYKRMLCKPQTHLYNSFKKYGVESHKFEIICQCNRADLNRLEQEFIKINKSLSHQNGLNLKHGGKSTNHSQETKDKIGLAQKKAWQSNPIRNSNKGKRMSIIAREKLSKARIGKYMFGENPNAKIVLDYSNGIFYTSLKEACHSKGFNYSTVKSNLQGVTTHSKFQLQYV